MQQDKFWYLNHIRFTSVKDLCMQCISYNHIVLCALVFVAVLLVWGNYITILRPRQNGLHFPENISKCIFLNENVWISLKISLMLLTRVWFNNTPALVQIMAWSRLGDKPLSESVFVRSLTHICLTRPKWVNMINWSILIKVNSLGLMYDSAFVMRRFRKLSHWRLCLFFNH